MPPSEAKPSKASPAPREAGWFPLSTVVEAFGLTKQGFHQNLRQILPETAIRGEGKRGVTVHLPTAIKAHAAAAVEKVKGNPRTGDSLLDAGGADSPALEEYRRARAEMAKMDLAERRGQIVALPALRSATDDAFGVLRSTGDKLTRLFGNDAGSLFNDMLADFEASLLNAYSKLTADSNALDILPTTPEATSGNGSAGPDGQRPARVRPPRGNPAAADDQ